jgi:hypothetical protein
MFIFLPDGSAVPVDVDFIYETDITFKPPFSHSNLNIVILISVTIDSASPVSFVYEIFAGSSSISFTSAPSLGTVYFDQNSASEFSGDFPISSVSAVPLKIHFHFDFQSGPNINQALVTLNYIRFVQWEDYVIPLKHSDSSSHHHLPPKVHHSLF